jgi:hypothetical protein
VFMWCHHDFAIARRLPLSSWNYKVCIIIKTQYDLCWNVTLHHYRVILASFIAFVNGKRSILKVATCIGCIWWDLTWQIINMHLAWWVSCWSETQTEEASVLNYNYTRLSFSLFNLYYTGGICLLRQRLTSLVTAIVSVYSLCFAWDLSCAGRESAVKAKCESHTTCEDANMKLKDRNVRYCYCCFVLLVNNWLKGTRRLRQAEMMII